MRYQIRELPPKHGHVQKITYIVTFDDIVFFTRELTRHVFMQMDSGYEYRDIVWGGVLLPDGAWERKSYDFGDAEDLGMREEVISLIKKEMGL